jgi:hypothetical protein
VVAFVAAWAHATGLSPAAAARRRWGLMLLLAAFAGTRLRERRAGLVAAGAIALAA